MKKSVTFALVIVFILSFCLCIMAAPNLQEAKVNIDYEMKILLHGQPFNPTDSQTGAALRPIIYKSRIYLPVGSICDAVELACNYDAKSNVLNIGEKLEYIPVDVKQLKVHSGYGTEVYLTKDLDLLYTPDKAYKWGLTTVGEFSHYWSLELLTNGEYTKFKGSIYNSDKNGTETIQIHAEKSNGEIVKVLKVEPGKTVDFEVNIQGIENLYIKKKNQRSEGRILLGEPQFK